MDDRRTRMNLDDTDSGNLDELLVDVKNLLGEDGPAEEPQKDRTLRQKLEVDKEATRIFDERYTSIIRGASESADRAARQYRGGVREPQEPRQSYPQQPDQQEPDQQPQQPPIRAYNSDFGGESRFRDNFSPRQPSGRMRQAEEEELRAGGGKPPKKRRRGRGCLTALIILLLLLGLAYGAFRLLGNFAKKDGVKTRKPGVTTVLLAGTDESGLRTDTLMLVTIDEKNKVYDVMSIPRDTLTYAPYSVPKINAAYGYYGQGTAGMNALLDLVQDCVGFRPDGYVLIDFNGFSELVDIMGGISFDVPVDMDVGEVQLKAGTQTLDGAEALAVARYRAGYSLADLQRVQVQRNLINAAMTQWLSLGKITKYPAAIQCVNKNTVTDLNVLNLLWLARDLKTCENQSNDTLPGEAKMIGDGSYYVLDPAAVVKLVNKSYNPYTMDITKEDLYIKVG